MIFVDGRFLDILRGNCGTQRETDRPGKKSVEGEQRR
jgi:hypothetical protein